MSEQNTSLIIRTIISVLSLLNAVLQMNGLPHLEIGDEVITAFVNSGVLIVTSIWTYWKNNNWTAPAKEAQTVLNAIKKGEAVDVTINGKEQTE